MAIKTSAKVQYNSPVSHPQNLAYDAPRLPETGFIRLPQILKLIPVSESTWWAGVASGRFPKQCKPTPRTSVWRCEDIRQLIEEIGRDAL
jgi:predicted DNA-binding transcriptional regulator AlpA